MEVEHTSTERSRICALLFLNVPLITVQSRVAILGLIFLAVALMLVGVGLAFGLVVAAITLLLLGLGVASSSLFIGIRSASASAGLRAFLLQCGVLGGVLSGVICAWFADSFLQAYGGITPVLIAGAFGGAVAGVLLALLTEYVLRRGAAWVTNRLPARG
jgi:hypothetical protein